ncbi:hypothetical protein [Paenibacillus sp. BAC0078]
MEFIKPIQKLGSKVDWQISDRTKAIVQYYGEYTGLSEDEVVNRFLINILKDPDFNQWINNKRRKTRIIKQLFPDNSHEVI